MSSAQIYDIKNNDRIESLLSQSGGPSGATLLIPDLQRPYVWTPSQVILLVDSLVHGWPFGTLLLWRVDDTALANIPHRQFWRIVDRTEEGDFPSIPEVSASLPAHFRMVLDGQQRMQSLLLALGGDGNGFRLTDRQWFDGLDRERPRGRVTAHWTFGQLCLDLDAFQQRIAGGVGVRDLDYRDVLAWVVRAPKEGESAEKRPANYIRPLPFASEHPGRFLALPRLWQLASSTPLDTFDYLDKLESAFLPAQGVSVQRIGTLKKPLAQLVKLLEEVKNSQVGVLELRAFSASAGDGQDGYGDAVVNIFTRLNTAGRTLTTQEITFAWIKRTWTLGPEMPAERAFRTLREDLARRAFDLSIDDVVQAAALVWAVLDNGGVALGPKDLLRGERVQPMVPGIANRWSRLAQNLLRSAEIVHGLGVAYGRHFQSLNAFLLLSLWRMTGEEWIFEKRLGAIDRIAAAKGLNDLVRSYAERWLALTTWAGRWRESSGEAVVQYLKELSTLWVAIKDLPKHTDVHGKLRERMDAWCAGVIGDAEVFVVNLAVERREDVRAYFLPLWIWHRLDESRWGFSSLHMDAAKARQSLEVDHIVAVALWNALPQDAQDDTRENGDATIVNDLGNMFLLEKNFNIGKSDKPLASLLARVGELADGATRETFLRALGIDEPLFDPTRGGRLEIGEAIERRGAQIRQDLVDYIRGARTPPSGIGPAVEGTWDCLISESGSDAPERAVMKLRRVGTAVDGSYAYDGGVVGKIAGRVHGSELLGTWREKRGNKGTVRLTFGPDATAFEGRWDWEDPADGGGQWTGRWKEEIVRDEDEA